MTKEEKEAIERLDRIEVCCADDGEAITVVLNLIQKQQAETEKKDKIIDLMADWFEEWAEFIDEENYYTIFRKMSKEDIKEYFKKKVEDK